MRRRTIEKKGSWWGLQEKPSTTPENPVKKDNQPAINSEGRWRKQGQREKKNAGFEGKKPTEMLGRGQSHGRGLCRAE